MAFIVGTLGRKPDPFDFGNGSEVSNFTVATTNPNTHETVWHKIVAKGALANLCNSKLDKGSVVSVVGIINNRTYIDNHTGQSKDITEFIAQRVDIISNPLAANMNPSNQFNEFPNQSKPYYRQNQNNQHRARSGLSPQFKRSQGFQQTHDHQNYNQQNHYDHRDGFNHGGRNNSQYTHHTWVNPNEKDEEKFHQSQQRVNK